MRNLPDVIDQILVYIPESAADLRAALTSIKESSQVAAPEMQSFWWAEGFDAITESGEFPESPEDAAPWQKKVHDIWMNLE